MRLLYVFCLPLTAIALLAQTPAPNSTSSQQSPVNGYTAPLQRTRGKHGQRGAWQAGALHVYTVSLPDGVTPSPATETSVNFEMPYRDSNRVRFILRDDASGRVGSTEITIDPSRTS